MSQKQADYLISGGLVVRGSGVTRENVLVRDGKIEAVGSDLSCDGVKRIIDASGTYVFPGIIDAHNHPIYADRIETFSLSAAFGGITTVVPFIQSQRAIGIEGTTLDAVNRFLDEAHETSYLDFGIHAILMGDDDVKNQVPELIKMGVISFKMFMTYPRRGMMMPDDKMLLAMKLASQEGGLAMVHAENGYCIDFLVDDFTDHGLTGREHYAATQPRILEVEAFERAATYATVTECPLYVVHLSAREILGSLKKFKDRGLRLFGETCPQYLALTNQEMLDHGVLAKIGPPLREREDNDAMWRGLETRLIDTIASDFCGFNKAQKFSGGQSAIIDDQADLDSETNIFNASFGGNWAEQMLCVAFEEGVNQGRITLPRLVQVMCENPAKIFGLYPKKGAIQPGSDADIVLFDPSVAHTLSADAQHCVADFTMFEGKKVLGKPVFTMQRGEIIVEDGEMKRSKGKAQFLHGNPTLAAYTASGYSVE